MKLKKCVAKLFIIFLPTLTFVSDCFVTKKMIKKLYTALFADDKVLFFDEYAGNVTIATDKISILRVNLNNIYHYDASFYKDDPKNY